MNILQKIWIKAAYKIDNVKWNHFARVAMPKLSNGTSQSVLICEVYTNRAAVKIHALIAAELCRSGVKVTVIFDSRNPTYEAIYKAVVRDIEFLYFDQLPAEPEEAEVLAAEFADVAQQDLDGFLDLEHDGFRVGKNLMSTVVRQLRLGSLSPQDPDQMAVLRQRALETATSVLRVKKLPIFDVGIFNERGYSPASEIFDQLVTSGKAAVQWVSSPLNDSIVMKRYRLSNRSQHPLALSKESWSKIESSSKRVSTKQGVVDRLVSIYREKLAYNRQELQLGKVEIGRDEIVAELGLDPAKKTAVIFSHILYDATFFYGESLFSNYEEWLIQTVGAAIRNDNLNWIVKVHPVNVWRSKMDGKPMEQLEKKSLERAYGELPSHVKIMPADTRINTLSLFNYVDYGLTVRGTVGMELPCFGLPVVTAGSGRYSGNGFTMDPSTPEEYAELLSQLHELPRLDGETVEKACAYYNAAILQRPVITKSFKQIFQNLWWQPRSFGSDVIIPSPGSYKVDKTHDILKMTRWIIEDNTEDLFGVEPNN